MRITEETKRRRERNSDTAIHWTSQITTGDLIDYNGGTFTVINVGIRVRLMPEDGSSFTVTRGELIASHARFSAVEAGGE